MKLSTMTPIERDDVDLLRGSKVKYKVYYEYGAQIDWDWVFILGWTPSKKRVRILHDDIVRCVKLESLQEVQP